MVYGFIPPSAKHHWVLTVDVSFGSTLALLWLHFGSTLALLWLHFGSTLAPLWLHFGSTFLKGGLKIE